MMECNRDEASRARKIAVQKLEKKDFSGAHKFAHQAQLLFPELENISQLLNVCNVHCAAEARVNGEMDWYAVLQVEPTADHPSIRKQYRKLAFSLHPDKNCILGAEAAFKLVAEAHTVLSDPTKRSHYDIRRQNASRKLPKQATQQPKKGDTSKYHVPGYVPIFWTICPHCQIRYQYHGHILNSLVCCPNCRNNFFAYNLKEQYVPSPSGVSSSSQVPKKMFQSQQGHPVKLSSTQGITSVKPKINVAQCDEYKKRYSKPSKEKKVNQSAATRGQSQFSTMNQDKPSVEADSMPSREKKANQSATTGLDSKFSAMNEDKPYVQMENENVAGWSIPDPAGQDIVDKQKLGTEEASPAPNAMDVPGPMEIHLTGVNMYMKERINVPQCDIKGNSSAGGEKAVNQSDITRGRVEIPMINPSKSSGRTANKNLGPADLNLIDRKNLSKEDISTVQKAIGPSSLRRKQDADCNSSLNPSSKKKQRKSDFSSNADLNCEKTFDDNVTKSDSQSVSSKVAIQEKAEARDISDQDNIKAKATYITGQNKPCYSEKKQRKSDFSSNAGLNCEKTLDDSVTKTDRQSVSSKVDIKEKAEARDISDQDNIKAKATDIAGQNKPCYSEKKQRKSDFSSNAGLNCEKIFDDSFTKSDRQSVPGKLDIQEKGEAAHIIDQGNNKVDATDTASQNKPCYSEKKQSNVDVSSNAGSNCKKIFDDNTINADRQAVSGKVDIQEKGEAADIIDLGNSKVDAIGTASQNKPCYSEQKKRKTVCSPNAGSNCKKIFDDNITNTDRPSVLSEVDMQEKDQDVDTSGQDNIKADATDTNDPCYSVKVIVPNPDFFDFEKLRDANLFAVGQIWAIYDSLDGMPRFYARIKCFDTSNFKVHLTWLEYSCRNAEEDKWIDEELPVACGNFCLEKTEISVDRLIFSHIVSWEKGKRRNCYEVYPRKGEVWALYKGWSMQWGLDADNHRSYEYEIVQILSNFSVNLGVTVVPLVRIKGFVSLFATAKDKAKFIVPSNELLRFSHNISFYRTDGNERVGVPGGLFELDTGCLPVDLDESFTCVTLGSCMSPGKKKDNTFTDLSTGSTDNRMRSGKENHSEPQICRPLQKNGHSSNGLGDSSQQNSPLVTYPDSEFHNFEECRSCENFESGQIWALYSDGDSFPKYYGWVSKVELEPFRVHVTWLEPCPQLEQGRQWLRQHIPISCGIFRIRNWKTTYETNDTFSHLVYTRPIDTNLQVEILPQVGEIWAIYMNWAPNWTPSTDACKFAIGKIIEHTKDCSKVSLLTQVDGYTAVFKPDRQKGVVEIPAREILKFSHQVPSFRLTEERGGKLRGFYELDPASVPGVFL